MQPETKGSTVRRFIIASVTAALAAVAALSGVNLASASPAPKHHVIVSITDTSGHFTTGSSVVPGETLALYGYGPQNVVETVVTVTDNARYGYNVTLSDPGALPLNGQTSSTFDFEAGHR